MDMGHAEKRPIASAGLTNTHAEITKLIKLVKLIHPFACNFFRRRGGYPNEGDGEIKPKSSHSTMGGRGSPRAASCRKTHGLQNDSPGGSPSLAYTGHIPKGKGEIDPFFYLLLSSFMSTRFSDEPSHFPSRVDSKAELGPPNSR